MIRVEYPEQFEPISRKLPRQLFHQILAKIDETKTDDVHSSRVPSLILMISLFNRFLHQTATGYNVPAVYISTTTAAVNLFMPTGI